MDIRRQLSSIDVEARREAVLRLGEPGPDVAANVKLLLVAMQDSSWRVRKTAVETMIGNYTVESYVEGLIGLLYIDDNAGARNTAIEILTKLGRKVSDYLIDAFQTDNHDVRKFVIDIIGEIRDKKTVPLMIEALKDDDENVRASAVEHLGTMQEVSAVDALIEIIKGGDLWTAYPAADALGLIGDRRAVPVLVQTLQKKTLREPGLKALGRLADPESVRHIVPFIEDRSNSVQQQALNSLETMYQRDVPEDSILEALRDHFGERVIEVLLKHATGGKPATKRPAILFLGLLRDERALQPLLDMSADESQTTEVKKALIYIGKGNPSVLLPLFVKEFPYVKRFLCEIGVEVAAQEYYGIMLGLLQSEDGHVRSLAAMALANIGDTRAIRHIQALFTDPFDDVQEAAIEALAKLSDGLDIVATIGLLEDKSPVMRRNAALLLGHIGSSEAVQALGFAQKDGDVSVRRAALDAQSAIGTEESVKFLSYALTDEDPRIRASAALNLGSMGREGAVDSLCLLLADTDDMVKVASARALGRLASARSVGPLVEQISSPNGFVVTAVISALGKVGTEDARKAIGEKLKDKDPEVNRTAISALAGFSGAQEALMPFLSSQDWATRVAAVQALGPGANDTVKDEMRKVYSTEEDPVVRKSIEKFIDV